jgi:hypothetical protein
MTDFLDPDEDADLLTRLVSLEPYETREGVGSYRRAHARSTAPRAGWHWHGAALKRSR